MFFLGPFESLGCVLSIQAAACVRNPLALNFSTTRFPNVPGKRAATLGGRQPPSLGAFRPVIGTLTYSGCMNWANPGLNLVQKPYQRLGRFELLRLLQALGLFRGFLGCHWNFSCFEIAPRAVPPYMQMTRQLPGENSPTSKSCLLN
jgi:hypothetical protein